MSRVQNQAYSPYEILGQLSCSKTGSVFKARHQTTGQIVALKVLSPMALGSPQFVERFHRKAQILTKICHPNVVHALETGQREGSLFLIMEFVDGVDLRSIIKQQNLLTVRQAVDYTLQAASGLAAIHALGICHRNIKPSNLLIDGNGTIKIVGMGMAHVESGAGLGSEDVRLTMPGQVMGTYDFMAPEQALDSGTVDPRADIYGLGCTLYAMLTGRAPYPGKTPIEQVMAHREMPIPSLRVLRADVPEKLDLAFQKMMAKEPDQRPASAEELIADLRVCLAQVKQSEASGGASVAANRPARPTVMPAAGSMGPPLQGPPKTETSATVGPNSKAGPVVPVLSASGISPFLPASSASSPSAPSRPEMPAGYKSDRPPTRRETVAVGLPENRLLAEASPLTQVRTGREDSTSTSETPTPAVPPHALNQPLSFSTTPYDPGPLTWFHTAVVGVLLLACAAGLAAIWMLWPSM